jgi:acyl carrier protein
MQPDMSRNPDVIAVERWLVSRVACLAKQDAQEIDVTLPFSHYELDSVSTVQLTADLEDWLGVELSPTLIWDYPTTQSLARYLARTLESP